MLKRCQNCGEMVETLVKVKGYEVCQTCEAKAYMRPGVR